jgi:FkbM family methyltransferase
MRTLRRALGRIVRPAIRRRAAAGTGPLAGMRLLLPSGMEALYLNEPYEPELAAALARLVRPGWTCADVGAHVGYFTLLLARLVGEEGSVLAFEAAPVNAQLLAQNVKLNNLESRVRVENLAVADVSGELELYPARAGGSSEWTLDATFASRADHVPTERHGPRVRSVSLDDYASPAPRLDLVKMDIEGAEARAIRGMRRILREERPIILLEFHREVGWPAVQELRTHGYRFEELDGREMDPPENAAEVPYQFVARPGA